MMSSALAAVVLALAMDAGSIEKIARGTPAERDDLKVSAFSAKARSS